MRMSRRGLRALGMGACLCLMLVGFAKASELSDPGDAILLDQPGMLIQAQPGGALPNNFGEPSPRGGCNLLVYSNPVDANVANVAFGNLGLDGQWGQNVELLTGNHRLCRIEGKFAHVEGVAGGLPAGTEYQIEMTITNVCRHTGASGGCNGSDHDLLYGPALMDAPLLSTAAPLDLADVVTGVWTLPPEVQVNVLQCERVSIEFKAIVAGTLGIFDNTDPVIGVSPTGFSLCAGAQNGCSFTFTLNRNETCMDVFGDPVVGGGSCCDLRTGLCSQVASVDECSGGACPPPLGDRVFTFGGTCQTPDPDDIECDQPFGACCELALETCTTELSFDCTGAGKVFGLGEACEDTICPSECQENGNGQPYDYRVGRVISDQNPIINGFSGVTEGGIRNADNFVPTVDGDITSIRWWGLYNDPVALQPCPVPDSADNFTIRVYVSADIAGAGHPKYLVQGDYDGTITRQATGYATAAAVFGNEAIYQYTATGLSIPVSATQCYWLEIYNTTSGVCLWRWMLGPQGDNVFAQDSGPAPYDDQDPAGTSDRFVGDLAWCIDVAVNADGCTSAGPGVVGACCLDVAPFCDFLTPNDCSAMGGIAFGIGLPCPSTICEGACCLGTTCQQETGNDCNNLGGVFYGVGSECDPTPCFGACCSNDGTICVDGGSLANCDAIFGAFWPGAACVDVNCGQTFICDAITLACGESTQVNTTNLAGVAPQPVQPVTQSCFGTAPPNVCVPANPGECLGVGVFWTRFIGTGDAVSVSLCGSDSTDTVLSVYTDPSNDCGQIDNADEVACSEDETGCGPNGLLSAVCVPNTVLGQTYWVLAGGFDAAAAGIIEVSITCPCSVPCACPGDVNADDSRDGLDVQAFIDALGSNDNCADFDSSGVVDELDVDGFVDELLLNTGDCTP